MHVADGGPQKSGVAAVKLDGDEIGHAGRESGVLLERNPVFFRQLEQLGSDRLVKNFVMSENDGAFPHGLAAQSLVFFTGRQVVQLDGIQRAVNNNSQFGTVPAAIRRGSCQPCFFLGGGKERDVVFQVFFVPGQEGGQLHQHEGIEAAVQAVGHQARAVQQFRLGGGNAAPADAQAHFPCFLRAGCPCVKQDVFLS